MRRKHKQSSLAQPPVLTAAYIRLYVSEGRAKKLCLDFVQINDADCCCLEYGDAIFLALPCFPP